MSASFSNHQSPQRGSSKSCALDKLSDDPCLTLLSPPNDMPLPSALPYLFCYQPDPLAICASEDLQRRLQYHQPWQHNQSWKHNFGDVDQQTIGNAPQLNPIGKMFGVLVVKTAQGQMGYLSAFSGKLGEQNHWVGFVPPIFDALAPHGQFLDTTSTINQINVEIETLENSAEFLNAQKYPTTLEKEAQDVIEKHRIGMVEAKKERKRLRMDAQKATHEGALHKEKFENTLAMLAKQSVEAKFHHQQLKGLWQQKIEHAQQILQPYLERLNALKTERKHLSNQLQTWLFSQYLVLNSQQQTRSLVDIFSPNLPPAGAGECAAPKLFHYAFSKGYTPITMAEFWWSTSPVSEIRQHKNFYPSCQNKCHPIFSYMLDDLPMDDNPLLKNPAVDKEFSIVYQDEHVIVVNKPSEFLSVPGVHIQDSVYTRLQTQFANTPFTPLVVHRLDMSTSGLLIFALNPRANKHLQKQFIHRRIKKRYIALLEREITAQQGEIELPLIADLEDKPKQKVCLEQGKPALTRWELIETIQGRSKLYLYPHTGRTHQLRVHCAHSQGLNAPIVGDDLYGHPAERLHLHAEQLTFVHPATNELMTLTAPAPF